MAETPQQKAIDVLVSGGTQEQAAKAAGVNRRTILRWLKQPDFYQKLYQAKESYQEVVVEEVQKITTDVTFQELLPKAINTVNEILANPEARSADRLKAAQIALNILPKNEAGRAPQRNDDVFPGDSQASFADIDTDSEMAKYLSSLSDEEFNKLYIESLTKAKARPNVGSSSS